MIDCSVHITVAIIILLIWYDKSIDASKLKDYKMMSLRLYSNHTQRYKIIIKDSIYKRF